MDDGIIILNDKSDGSDGYKVQVVDGTVRIDEPDEGTQDRWSDISHSVDSLLLVEIVRQLQCISSMLSSAILKE